MAEKKGATMAEKNGSSTSTLKTVIFSGLFALLGTISGGVIRGYWDVQLAERKFYSDLVLKSLESNSSQERLETLKMLVHTNLLKDSVIKEGVDKYIAEKQQDPSSIPQVKPSATQTLEAPIIDNARIYLLSGKKENVVDFEGLRKELSNAGFTIIGAKNLVDPGRPDLPEVRYFNAADKIQAEKIAEFMRFKLNVEMFSANQYQDKTAKPGYIEIWLGR